MQKIVEIEMDKKRHLRYGINNMIQLEKRIGKPLSSLSNESFSLEDLRSILYIGLAWEDKSITEDQVGDYMDIAIEKNGMQYLSEKLSDAVQGAFGQQNAIPFNG